MKSLLLVLALACAGAGAAPKAPPVQKPPPGLRQVVEQYDAVQKSAPRRELSPAERAELRRQVIEYGQRGRRR